MHNKSCFLWLNLVLLTVKSVPGNSVLCVSLFYGTCESLSWTWTDSDWLQQHVSNLCAIRNEMAVNCTPLPICLKVIAVSWSWTETGCVWWGDPCNHFAMKSGHLEVECAAPSTRVGSCNREQKKIQYNPFFPGCLTEALESDYGMDLWFKNSVVLTWSATFGLGSCGLFVVKLLFLLWN